MACRLSILVVWHCTHAVVSGAVSVHSSNIKKLIDPVKSGVILLPRRDAARADAERPRAAPTPQNASHSA